MKTCRFSLIEVLLAMMIVSIGVLSIMGLIPIGVKAHRDAINQNQSADAADELLHYLAYFMKSQDWGIVEGTLGAEPPALPDYTVGWEDGQWAVLVSGQDYMKYFGSGGLDTPAEWVFRIVRQRDVKSPDSDAVVRQATEADFVMRAWKSQVKGWYKNSSGTFMEGDVPYDNALQLNVEVSWPGSTPYELRTKAHYSLEVRRGE